MRALYAVYQEKATDEIVGHVWLTGRDVEHIRRYGSLEMYQDEPLTLPSTWQEIPSSMKVDIFRFWLDRTRGRDAVYRLYTNATREQMTTLQKTQEKNFRFPVPISVLPG